MTRDFCCRSKDSKNVCFEHFPAFVRVQNSPKYGRFLGQFDYRCLIA